MDKTQKEIQDASYDHVLKYTGLFGGVQGVNMLMSLVRTKVAALLLGPEGIALINIFNNAVKLINEATNFGVSFSAVKHIAEIYEVEEADGETSQEIINYVGVVRTWSLSTGLLGMLVTLVAAPFISLLTFGNYDYALSFAMLSPLVLFLALSGGEVAILKGLKKLKRLAIASMLGALMTMLICTILYFLFGMKGIVPSLVLATGSVFGSQLYFSSKVIPWKTAILSSKAYVEGLPMLKLGISYIIAGIFGQGAEYVIRTLILKAGCLADVGLYNSGYTLAVTYASFVFIAIEADFFPRLSAAKVSVIRQNFTVNQQIEVCVLLIAPFLTLFVIAMPVIIPVLFSERFVEAVPMAICASFYMFFKALTLPVAYLSLAHGDSKTYMATELVYDVLIAIIIPLAYSVWGLIGCGFALSFAGLFDMLMIVTLYNRLYGFCFGRRLIPFYILQFVMLAIAVFVSIEMESGWKYLIEAVCVGISMGLSLRILSRETSFMENIKNKLLKR